MCIFKLIIQVARELPSQRTILEENTIWGGRNGQRGGGGKDLSDQSSWTKTISGDIILQLAQHFSDAIRDLERPGKVEHCCLSPLSNMGFHLVVTHLQTHKFVNVYSLVRLTRRFELPRKILGTNCVCFSVQMQTARVKVKWVLDAGTYSNFNKTSWQGLERVASENDCFSEAEVSVSKYLGSSWHMHMCLLQ